MHSIWTRDFLTRRIDRCYMIAAWTKAATKRNTYLALARHYRRQYAALFGRVRPDDPARA